MKLKSSTEGRLQRSISEQGDIETKILVIVMLSSDLKEMSVNLKYQIKLKLERQTQNFVDSFWKKIPYLKNEYLDKDLISPNKCTPNIESDTLNSDKVKSNLLFPEAQFQRVAGLFNR